MTDQKNDRVSIDALTIAVGAALNGVMRILIDKGMLGAQDKIYLDAAEHFHWNKYAEFSPA